MIEATICASEMREHDDAGRPDVGGVALGDALVDDVRVEARQVQRCHRGRRTGRRARRAAASDTSSDIGRGVCRARGSPNGEGWGDGDVSCVDPGRANALVADIQGSQTPPTLVDREGALPLRAKRVSSSRSGGRARRYLTPSLHGCRPAPDLRFCLGTTTSRMISRIDAMTGRATRTPMTPASVPPDERADQDERRRDRDGAVHHSRAHDVRLELDVDEVPDQEDQRLLSGWRTAR